MKDKKPTQKDLILNYIVQFGSITPMEAFFDLSITKLATRISELRKEGWDFDIDTEQKTNRYGKTVRYAKYSKPRYQIR